MGLYWQQWKLYRQVCNSTSVAVLDSHDENRPIAANSWRIRYSYSITNFYHAPVYVNGWCPHTNEHQPGTNGVFSFPSIRLCIQQRRYVRSMIVDSLWSISIVLYYGICMMEFKLRGKKRCWYSFYRESLFIYLWERRVWFNGPITGESFYYPHRVERKRWQEFIGIFERDSQSLPPREYLC